MIVSPAWLHEHLGEVRVFDASLPSASNKLDVHVGFARAHIPGAQLFDIDAISDPTSPYPRMLPSLRDFERAMGALGLTPSMSVVVYDQLGAFSAPRAWWMLRAMGHEGPIQILDGGLPAWLEAELPTESGDATAQPETDYDARLRAELVRSVDEVLAHTEAGDALILDARSRGRFDATSPEPRAGLRGGHIPGSVSLPHGELLGEDGRFLAPEALRALFEARGVGAGTQVVTTCGSGVTAAKLSFGMAVAGLEPGAVYDGSWTEWGARADLPIE